MGPSLASAFFLLLPASVWSQISLVESGGGVKKAGETLTLTCAVSGISLPSTDIHWIRQPEGKGLEWVGVIWSGGHTDYNDVLQSRVSITREPSKSQVFVQLSGLQPADTALYRCARYSQ